MKFLITGVAGLIGSSFADFLCDNGIEVIGIDDLSGGYIENVHKNVNFIKMDVKDDNLKNVFNTYRPDIVCHFAAYAAEGLSPFIRKYNYENNLLSTANIINNCITYDVKRLLFTSTMAVYGNNVTPFNEEYIPNPIDPYGVAKYACEMDIKIAGQQHGLDWCIIRPHNVYGIKQNIWDKYRNVLGIWIYQILNDLPMTIYGTGNQKRAFSYIKDCIVPIFNACMWKECSKQIINLGGTTETSILNAAKMLQDITGHTKIKYMEQRHEVTDAWSTYDKSIQLLQYNEMYNLYSGLVEMWEWAKTQPTRDRFHWKEYEINKGIYSYWKGT